MSTTERRKPYPLSWPAHWKRTEKWQQKNGKPPFSAVHFNADLKSIVWQLKKMGAAQIVITSDLPLRNDGIPYADARCDDPGLAIWYVLKGKEMVIACDRWRSVQLNLGAIKRTLEAMRGMERWGCATLVEKAFAGFAALPPAGHTSESVVEQPPPPNWREVFEVPGVFEEQLGKAELLDFVKLRYKRNIAVAHPDAGGDAVRASILNQAMEEAEKELTA